jgi:hypothetical protein
MLEFRIWLENNEWWQTPIEDVINAGFKYIGPANIGGASQKYFLQSKLNGKKYVFRPGAKYSELRPQQPHADTLASQMSSHLLEPGEYVPAGLIKSEDVNKIEGAPPDFLRFSSVGGSVQPFIDEAESKDYRYSSQELSDNDIKKLQREQVIDWLISNHDSHGNQFIRHNGNLLGIDKSQALKYFGVDDLSPNYSPNSVYGEDDPIYNYIFRDVQSGKRNLDPMVIKPLLDKVERIPDNQYLSMFMSFIQSMKQPNYFRSGMKGMAKLGVNDNSSSRITELLLSRKHNIKRSFSDYYSKMLGRRVNF